MSVDKSLRLQSALQRARSVLSRAERIAELREAGKWRDGDTVFGLVKVKVRRVKRRHKTAAKVEGAEAAAPVAAGAVPAAGAAPGPAAAAPKGAPEKSAAKEKAGPKDKAAKK